MKVTCVVDDAVQRSSPFWGEHGLAFLIAVGDRRVLFDMGQSGTVLLRNLGLLGVDLATIDALAVSHGHYDHGGGLPALLEGLRPYIPLYANADLFRGRFSLKDGQPEDVGLDVTQAELARALTIHLSDDPQEIVPGLWTTGAIRERPELEGKSPSHQMREGERLVPDEYRDDMGLVWESGDHLVLICGCCHAGLLNTMAQVQRHFAAPIEAIVGGLHLTSATAGDLQHVGEVLAAMPTLRRVYPNHCTGEAAYVALTQILGPSVVGPCPAGTVLEF